MIPQGSVPFNPEIFAQLRAQIEAVDTCSGLQELAAQGIGSAQAQLGAVTQQLEAVAPILALLSAPGANPAQIVTWITDFITAFLDPYVKPYTTLPIQIAALTAEIAQLTTAVQDASSRIGNCTVPIPPPITIPPLP